MKKFNISNFYVGKLNFAFKFGSVIVPVSELPYDEASKIILQVDTISRGAIDLRNLSEEDITDYTKRIKYNSVYTIFYKMDDRYYCLHNDKYYKLDGFDFCSELVPLSSCLPKYSCKVKDEISFREAHIIFRNLFGKKRKTLYNDDKYPIDDFYVGYIDLCTSYEVSDISGYDKKSYDYDMFKQLIVYGNDTSFTESGYYSEHEVDSKRYEANYSTFKVAFLKIDEEHLYNINDYSIYRDVNRVENDLFAPDFEIKMPLRKALEYEGINYQEEMSIPKIIQLQKKLQ